MEKLAFIEVNIFPDAKNVFLHGVFLPLVTSLLLIFVYPKPAEFIYRRVKMNQRRLKEIQQSIDDESPLSKEQARKIRREALENQLKYEAEIDSKTSENGRLKELVAELQASLNKYSDPVSLGAQEADTAAGTDSDIVKRESYDPDDIAGNFNEQKSYGDRSDSLHRELVENVRSFHRFSQPRSANKLPLSENEEYYSSVFTLIKKLMKSGSSQESIREKMLGIGVSAQMISRVLSGINNGSDGG